MHHHINPIKSALEELLVSNKLELVRHNTCSICKHAILRNNSITCDATRLGHSVQPSLP